MMLAFWLWYGAMARAGLSPTVVVDVALRVGDRDGAGALTLAAVAAECGVSTPSLYKHVASLGDLRALIGLRIMHEMTATFTTAALGRAGDEAVVAVMHAYRDYARTHPARYAAMPADPLHDPALVEAGTEMLTVFAAMLREYGLAGADLVHAVRRMRAVAHGFVSIEVAGGFGLPEKLDETYDQLVDMVITSLRRP
jgi:AcrR family transcriptional regulator